MQQFLTAIKVHKFFSEVLLTKMYIRILKQIKGKKENLNPVFEYGALVLNQQGGLKRPPTAMGNTQL